MLPDCRSSARTATSTCGSSPTPDARLEPPGRLFVTGDHYVVRMLYSQGVPLEAATRRRPTSRPRRLAAARRQRRTCSRCTPDGALAARDARDGLRDRAASSTRGAGDLRRESRSSLRLAEFAPRALLDRFGVECLSTTDPAGSPLDDHRGLREQPATASGRRSAPTRSSRSTRPAGATRSRRSRPPPAARSATTRRSSTRSPSGGKRSRRSARRRPTTRRRAPTRRGSANADAARRLRRRARGQVSARRGAQLRGAHAERVRADEPRRRPRHAAPRRQPARPQRARSPRGSAPTSAADIPVATDWTRGLRPLLEACGNDPGFAARPVHARREHVQPRARAARRPLSRRSCSAARGGSTTARPGIDRFLDRVTETAGIYNLAGFVDDARALTALPARHDLWRRRTCGWLARKVAARLRRRGRGAYRLARELAYDLARRAYRLDLDAAERVEAAVDGDDDPGDERRAGAAQPDHGARELVAARRSARPACRDDPLAALGQRARCRRAGARGSARRRRSPARSRSRARRAARARRRASASGSRPPPSRRRSRRRASARGGPRATRC